ncbi:Uncharacterised protein [Mycobacteroides abscessus subsp. bolletii]|nr:Uncharacterised protein [Mycobacteroides abscessus subsp. bolletii]SKS05205.1 Uncharacterised protein [Mycobacteroides abscessus subsp. abscessus]SHW62703.1 Uncharacterised protein [Mycobacteroides abscessus subsp. bolletii]SHW90721.1 Uncharacterised protein [Mycobacteroides abscessus subsp. bolletii]SHX34704.1 Uncharacterised protein [Mycobacteroides abscessus subsp. bolletii]
MSAPESPLIALTDLQPFAPDIDPVKAQAMIDDALAMAELVAPCIVEDDFPEGKTKVLKAILRGAILRWNEQGQGALAQQIAGPWTQTFDNRTPRRVLFWPSEITQLQNMCRSGDGGAYAIDTVPQETIEHADICNLNFGAQYCSCGAVLTGLVALWEACGDG